MSDKNFSKIVTLVNDKGMHARVAALIFKFKEQYPNCEILIEKDGKKACATSILSMLTIGAVKGDKIKITAKGSDGKLAVEKLASIINSGFKEKI